MLVLAYLCVYVSAEKKKKMQKRSKKIEQNFSSEQAKHMRYGSNFALFRLFFKRNGRTLVPSPTAKKFSPGQLSNLATSLCSPSQCIIFHILASRMFLNAPEEGEAFSICQHC